MPSCTQILLLRPQVFKSKTGSCLNELSSNRTSSSPVTVRREYTRSLSANQGEAAEVDGDIV